MIKITGDESAMPLKYEEEYGDHGQKLQFVLRGLTIRHQFAAMAMQGLVSSVSESSFLPEDCAKASVQYADALIEELNKEP